MPILVEACVETVESAIAAVKACVRIPVFVIIRPRGGAFVYSDAEHDVMRRDIDAARHLGADGFVFGVLSSDARVDEPRMKMLVAAAAGLPVTFHRAFDRTPDQIRALEALIACGVDRVLTSGGAATAIEGVDQLAALVARSGGRIRVLAGGGIRPAHVQELVRRGGVEEIHVRGTRLARTAMTAGAARVRLRKPLPDDEDAWEETDEEQIRALMSLAQM